MFDTIGLRCFTNESLKWQNLEYSNEHTDIKTGLVTGLSGGIKNLRIYTRQDGYKIEGSLPKYFLGNNLQTLSRKQTMQAVENLSDDLGINIKESKLFRFDIASNFIMQNKVINYQNLLDELSRFKKSFYKSTLYYSTDKIELVFYNKTKEMSNKRQYIPESFKQYKGKILRYEMRYLKNPKSTFHKDILLKDLSNETFYIQLIKKWKEYYFKITKKNLIKFNNMALSDVKLFQNQLMLYGLIALGGFDEVSQMIELSRNEIGRHKVKRIKDKLKELRQSKELTETNPLIKELDYKIETANSNFW